MRALRVTGNLCFLPGRKLPVQFLQGKRGFCLEPANLFADGDGIAAFAHRAKFFDLGLKFSHRLFEIEVTAHWISGKCTFRGDLTRRKPLSQASGLISLLCTFLASCRPMDGGRVPAFSAVLPAREYRFEWLRCRRDRAAFAPRAGRRRYAEDGWQRRGA